jgi:hypothetical protein
MEFDIDKLSKGELLELNRRIVERLKYLSERETLELSRKFRVGDEVEFRSGETMTRGMVIRINRKTLGIRTREGRWNIPPQFLRKVKERGKSKQLKVIK